MTSSVLIISNNRHSIAYSSGLSAYGFQVEDTRTIDAGRILLKSGSNPQIILIDMKQHASDIETFVHFVRDEQHNRQVYIVVIGCENDFLAAYGVDKCLERGIDVESIISVLQSSI